MRCLDLGVTVLKEISCGRKFYIGFGFQDVEGSNLKKKAEKMLPHVVESSVE